MKTLNGFLNEGYVKFGNQLSYVRGDLDKAKYTIYMYFVMKYDGTMIKSPTVNNASLGEFEDIPKDKIDDLLYSKATSYNITKSNQFSYSGKVKDGNVKYIGKGMNRKLIMKFDKEDMSPKTKILRSTGGGSNYDLYVEVGIMKYLDPANKPDKVTYIYNNDPEKLFK